MAKHVHADLMLQFAYDAQETDKPWELWEFCNPSTDEWLSATTHPFWHDKCKYRRKPKIISVTLANGEIISWPEPIKHITEINGTYFAVNHEGVVFANVITNDNVNIINEYITLGLVHTNCDAAERHARALYKINNQHKDN